MSARRIYKYVIAVRDRIEIIMPHSAKILCVQGRKGQLCLWAEVETEGIQHDKPPTLERRTFYVVGTGNPMPPSLRTYLGTVQQESFVWHVYEGV